MRSTLAEWNTFGSMYSFNSSSQREKTFLYHCLYHNFLLFVSFCWNIFSWRNPGFNSGKYRHWLSRFSFWKRKNAVAALNDQKVLEKIPSDDKEILDFLNSYYCWYIVLGLSVGFFLLMLYQIGKMYRENSANGVLINIPLYTKFLKIWRNALVLRKCRIYF